VGSSIFYNDLTFREEGLMTTTTFNEKIAQETIECIDPKDCMEDGVWNMSFDSAVNQEGAGAGIWVSPPKTNIKLDSYKLVFECTNNMAKYEALIFGLQVLKELGTQRIEVCDDSELIINQVKGVYQTRHPRLRAYKNMALDLLEGFSKYDMTVVPREQNHITDTLVASASVFKIPTLPDKIYEIEVKHRPAMPDNIKHWQVFDDDKQVERFLLMSDEFANTNIDREYCGDEEDSANARSDNNPFHNQIAGRDIIQLKNNIIPKGLVLLEKMFDKNDVAKNPRISTSAEDVEDCNIRTKAKPKIVKL
jgi:ribonuclease HI